jgi:hypothetical protein
MRQSAAKSFAYILGVYLGDGCVNARGYYYQNTIDQDFAEAVKQAFDRIADRPARITYAEVPKKGCNCSPQWTVLCSDRPLLQRFVVDTGGKARIPEYVLGWDRELRQQFVIGLMDSEGFVAAIHRGPGYDWKVTNRSFYMGYKSCDPWVPELMRVMESIGLRLGKVGHEKPRKPGYKAPMRFHIKMQSWINSGCRFNIARKQDRVDEWGSIGPYERRALHPRGGPQRLCSVDGCGVKYLAKGLCSRHYYQAKAKLRDPTPDPLPGAVMIESALRPKGGEVGRNDQPAIA